MTDRALGREQQAEIRRWVDRLIASAGNDRRRAAEELGRLGVATRGSVRTRGSLGEPARNRLPDPDKLAGLTEAMWDNDKDIRCQIVRALGEWGGSAAASTLARLAESEEDEDVRLYCVTALKTIGGPEAVRALCNIVDRGRETERDTAIAALEELATGGRLEDTQRPLDLLPSQPGQSREAIRTRGALPGEQTGGQSVDLFASVSSALRRLVDQKGTSPYLRHRALNALRYFTIDG
jgi:HEAT repeat protein